MKVAQGMGGVYVCVCVCVYILGGYILIFNQLLSPNNNNNPLHTRSTAPPYTHIHIYTPLGGLGL